MTAPTTATSTATPTIALVGNPNTGKTTLFNALSGLNQRVGNYPGVTVETKKGQFRHDGRTISVIDLPGTYSLAARSPDEMVAVDVILGDQNQEPRPDVVVTIVDASNLERNLYLTTQVLELGVPVVCALNMMDVAQSQDIKIDVASLSQQLGVPVVPIQANKSKGLVELKAAILEAIGNEPPPNSPPFPEAFEREVSDLQASLGNDARTFVVRRLLLDIGGSIERRFLDGNHAAVKEQLSAARERLAEAKCPVPAVEARTRYAWIRQITGSCVTRPTDRRTTWTDRLDYVLTHKLWGSLSFAALMLLVFVAIFWGGDVLMGWVEAGQEWIANLVTNSMSPGPLRSLLVDGVVGGVGGVLVFLPQIMILFAFIAVLEDCGYMARAAYLMDKLMSRAGLSGKSFIPMLSSVACAIPGIMGARVIENNRDRLATILVAPLMSCSARLPVYLLLTSAFLGPPHFPWWVPAIVLFSMYLVGIVVAPVVAYALKGTLLKGETPPFVMEMPGYTVPSIRSVLNRMGQAGWLFVRRAGTLILASMIVIWALLYFPMTNPATGEFFETEIVKLAETIENEVTTLEELEELEGLSEEEKSTRKELKAKVAPVKAKINQLEQEWRTNSILGQMGKAIEPIVEPLGWDWKIGMAAIASFPAREVFVGTLGIIYSQGEVDAGDEGARAELGDAVKQEFETHPIPTALSIMVFFALCAQCVSTLAVIKRETNSWFWPAFTFAYMTILAYIGALVVYQVGVLISNLIS